MGACWETGSWAVDSWALGTWADIGGTVAMIKFRGFLVNVGKLMG